MSETKTGRKTGSNQSAPLPTAAQAVQTFEAANDLSRTLMNVRSPSIRIPPTIRVCMRGLNTLTMWWLKNRAVYTGLADAQQAPANPATATTPTRTQRAGGATA